MGKSLIIVESPAKIKTLKKFLGADYLFESSVGHVRDLPEREFGIDIEHNFTPHYVIMPDKAKVITALKAAAKNCDVIFLCPDPDREGEAIAWHIQEILKSELAKKALVFKRVTFNSITKEAVAKALKEPREIDLALVDAQQARRLLDRIVGYKISPILNRRIQRGKGESVSAGRVQSVALKLVVEREKEIEAFKPVEYWKIEALFKKENDEKVFKAYLYSVDGKRVAKEEEEGKDLITIGDKDTAFEIAKRIENGKFKVESLDRKEKRRFPVPPFITSTLQQEASRHFGFSSARTMSIAQKLYEGIDLGKEGPEGLITYMRTDSTRVAPEAISEARSFISKTYGSEFIPETPKFYSTKKSAQDAHEAIRPANLQHAPEKLEPYLTKEEFLLYQLIWRRFLASQMMPAVYDTLAVDIVDGKGIKLRANGSIIKFQGFLVLYEEKFDEENKDDEARILPPLEVEDLLKLLDATSEQAFTRPPPRFTEASLIKELEKSGIGRPSTYAAIMNKIQSRDYTVKESGRLKPTEIGRVIAQLLETNFTEIMNVGFTAAMEDDLELIAENKKDWKKLINDFWDKFFPVLETAEKQAFVPKIETDIACPSCKTGKLQKVWFKNKYFFGCTNYPECTYSAPVEEITFRKEDYSETFNWDQLCPDCQSPMKVRHGRFGAFLGCSRYPDCKGIVNIPKKGEELIPESELPPCPAIGCTGKMVQRRSRFGKMFFSCSTFPDCDVIGNTLEDLETKYQNHERKAYVSKRKKKAAPVKAAASKKSAKNTKAKKAKAPAKKTAKREMPKFKVSKELEAIVKEKELSFGDATKKVWEYIKEKELQDKNDKRSINPDKTLSKVLGSSDSINMLKLGAHLKKHLTKKEEG